MAVIANEWKSLNADVAALEDRGHVISFEPSPLEVHLEAATWFWDQEVFNFIGKNLHFFEQPSLRSYVLAFELKQAHLDWKTAVLSRCLQGAALEVARLKADPTFPSEEDRVIAFVEREFGSRAAYFNYARKLRAGEKVPAIKLSQSTSPQSEKPLADIEQILRRRHGRLGNG